MYLMFCKRQKLKLVKMEPKPLQQQVSNCTDSCQTWKNFFRQLWHQAKITHLEITVAMCLYSHQLMVLCNFSVKSQLASVDHCKKVFTGLLLEKCLLVAQTLYQATDSMFRQSRLQRGVNYYSLWVTTQDFQLSVGLMSF